MVDDIQVESSSHGQIITQPEPVITEPIDPSPQGDGDPGDESDELDPAAGKPKPDRRSIQAKIDAQTAKQRTAERERDAERQRADAAERELHTLKQPKSTDTPAQPRYTRPKPTEDEIGSKYETYGAYVEDLTDWKVEQRDAQQAEHAQRTHIQRSHAQHAETFSTRIAKAEETDPEFWSKMSPAVVNLRPSGSLEPGERPTALTAIADVIFTSEHTTDLMLHFSQHPREFQRLSTLPPNQLYREMGRLEAQYTTPAAAHSGPAAKPVPVSQAAPPIKPVGSTASTGSDPDPLSEDLDMDTHIRVMNAKERKAGRR